MNTAIYRPGEDNNPPTEFSVIYRNLPMTHKFIIQSVVPRHDDGVESPPGNKLNREFRAIERGAN